MLYRCLASGLVVGLGFEGGLRPSLRVLEGVVVLRRFGGPEVGRVKLKVPVSPS